MKLETFIPALALAAGCSREPQTPRVYNCPRGDVFDDTCERVDLGNDFSGTPTHGEDEIERTLDSALKTYIDALNNASNFPGSGNYGCGGETRYIASISNDSGDSEERPRINRTISAGSSGPEAVFVPSESLHTVTPRANDLCIHVAQFGRVYQRKEADKPWSELQLSGSGYIEARCLNGADQSEAAWKEECFIPGATHINPDDLMVTRRSTITRKELAE